VPPGSVRFMTTSSTGPAQTLTARSPEDVLAAVPLVLGFVPEESVVMLTFGAADPFHGRLDLPQTAHERRAAAETLAAPAAHHGVRRVLFVLYAADPLRARSCARELVRVFARRGIDVVDVLRSDGRRWFTVPLEGPLRDGDGTPYDLSGHLFTAQAVAAGRVTRASRAELAASVAADPGAVRAVGAAVRELRARDPASEGHWVRETVARLTDEGLRPDPARSARALMALRDPATRDAVLVGAGRRGAERQLPVWSALVRAAPPGLVSPVASVLAFLAWLAGDGALAWCALERAAEGDPPCPLAERVAGALEQALPPARWEQR
jgi:Domain of unknown function (DUF4192)